MKKYILLISIVGAGSFSSLVYAQMMPGEGMPKGEQICKKIISDSESEGEPETKKELIKQRAQQKRQQQDQQAIQKRSLSKEKRSRFYQEILDRIDTDDKEAALDVFKQEIEAAITEYQNIHDQIISDFREQLDGIFSGFEIAEQKTGLGMVKNIEMKVFMTDLKTYCEEGTFTDEEISKMYKEKMAEVNGQKTGTGSGDMLQNESQGYLANNTEVLELKEEKSQELNMARDQMQKTIKNAAEKLKASQ